MGMSCTVCYSDNKEELERRKDNFLKKKPDAKIEINPVFSLTRKVGPFVKENKKSIIEILLDDPVIKAKGKAYVMEQLKLLEMEECAYRRVKTLSGGQLERVSVLYDVLRGKEYVLLYDADREIKDSYYIIAAWLEGLKEFKEKDGTLVWFTELPIKEFMLYPKNAGWSQELVSDIYHRLPHFDTVLKVSDTSLEEASRLKDFKDAYAAYIETMQEVYFGEFL